MYKSNNGKFKEGIIWWDTKKDPKADVDIFFYIHDYDKRAENSYGFKTLEIDLSKSADKIFSEYKSSVRREIRISNEYSFHFEYKNSLSNNEIEKYVNTYNSFANFKGIQNTSFELIEQMCEDNKLIFSYVSKDRALIAVHCHYVSNGRARLYQSFSTNNEFDNKIKGFANKALTHSDINYFKNQGIKIYDFGGIGNVEGDNTKFEGIIRFKKQFGGKEVILWKGVTPNGERGKEVFNKYFK